MSFFCTFRYLSSCHDLSRGSMPIFDTAVLRRKQSATFLASEQPSSPESSFEHDRKPGEPHSTSNAIQILQPSSHAQYRVVKKKWWLPYHSILQSIKIYNHLPSFSFFLWLPSFTWSLETRRYDSGSGCCSSCCCWCHTLRRD